MEPTEGGVGEANRGESLRRMGCEMVSNAALRSRRMRMEKEPESAAMRRL